MKFGERNIRSFHQVLKDFGKPIHENFCNYYDINGMLTASVSNLYSHSGGLNKQGCHAGSKPYHCHRQHSTNNQPSLQPKTKITGIVTHAKKMEINRDQWDRDQVICIKLSENGTQKGNYATRVASNLKV